jgi:hypothetical protein
MSKLRVKGFSLSEKSLSKFSLLPSIEEAVELEDSPAGDEGKGRAAPVVEIAVRQHGARVQQHRHQDVLRPLPLPEATRAPHLPPQAQEARR